MNETKFFFSPLLQVFPVVYADETIVKIPPGRSVGLRY